MESDRKNLISYTFLQEVRRKFLFRYKANFGNLVNNTVQKLIGDEVWKTSTMKEEKWDRDFNKIFQNELGLINENPPVDNKDKFAREQGIPFPGGPKIESLAREWGEGNPSAKLEDYSLPYAVQGMDLAFSGVLNAAYNLIKKGAPLGAVCWSIQEHTFAACIEVAERALAHTSKRELLLGGGVACNSRLREMSELMATERGSESFVPERKFCVDNGSMIAVLGKLHLMHKDITELSESSVLQYLRTDQTPILWA